MRVKLDAFGMEGLVHVEKIRRAQGRRQGNAQTILEGTPVLEVLLEHA